MKPPASTTFLSREANQLALFAKIGAFFGRVNVKSVRSVRKRAVRKRRFAGGDAKNVRSRRKGHARKRWEAGGRQRKKC